MTVFKKDKTIASFSANMTANYTVNLGDTIQVETFDCYGGQVNSSQILRPDIDLGIMNQATGPFYVNELTTNDVLKIDIKNIELDDYGIMLTSKGLGILGDTIKQPETKLLLVKNDYIQFTKDLHIPVQPMIGVIGTAPKYGRISCANPGNHGGNMDTKEIAPGNTLYLPVFQEGGLFALGDIHASMGDGEMNGTGVEIGGKSTLHISKITDKQITSPIIEKNEHFIFISSAETLETAMKNCANCVVNYLITNLEVNFGIAYRLLSATCDMRISQIVNELVTVKISVPKKLLPQLF